MVTGGANTSKSILIRGQHLHLLVFLSISTNKFLSTGVSRMWNYIVLKQRSSSSMLKISFKRKGKSFQCLKCHLWLPPLFSFHVYFSCHGSSSVSDWNTTHCSVFLQEKKKSGFTTDSCPAHSKSVLTSKKNQIFLAFNGCLSVFLQEGVI